MQGGSFAASMSRVSRFARRRSTTAPEASRPTTLQTFLPKIDAKNGNRLQNISHSLFLLLNPGEPTAPEGGAGHSISLPARLDEIGREKGVDPGAIEVWFADEARIGQKNKITRRWAKRGSRPSAPSDQRTASAYIFGAICPKEGKGAALIMPRSDTEAMNLHLAEIATQVARAHTPPSSSIRPDGIFPAA